MRDSSKRVKFQTRKGERVIFSKHGWSWLVDNKTLRVLKTLKKGPEMMGSTKKWKVRVVKSEEIKETTAGLHVPMTNGTFTHESVRR